MILAFAKAVQVFCIGYCFVGVVSIVIFGIWLMVEEEINDPKWRRMMLYLLEGEFVALFLSFWLDSYKLWG